MYKTPKRTSLVSSCSLYGSVFVFCFLFLCAANKLLLESLGLLFGAAVLARPLQHVKVPTLLGAHQYARVPRAAVLARPLQHGEMSARGCELASPLVPRAAVGAQPLQHLKVPAGGCAPARLL